MATPYESKLPLPLQLTPPKVEHNIKAKPKAARARRPSMTSFFSQLSQISTASTPSNPHNNPHATPNPVEMAAASQLLIDQLSTILANSANAASSAQDDPTSLTTPAHTALLHALISSTQDAITSPPTTVQGVPQAFLDTLERVPKSQLRPADTCPICNEPFLDDAYPLVVRLPCHKSHRFDLDCVGPWLLMNGTCPLDRKDVEGGKGKREERRPKEEMVQVKAEEDEDDYDGMFA